MPPDDTERCAEDDQNGKGTDESSTRSIDVNLPGIVSDRSEPERVWAEWSIEDALVPEGKRRENREWVPFEWCQTIRTAGESYRDTGSVTRTAAEMGLSKNEAQLAVSIYRLIFVRPPIDEKAYVSQGPFTTGTQYFYKSRSVSDLKLSSARSSEDSTERVQEDIREFVGGVLRTATGVKELIRDGGDIEIMGMLFEDLDIPDDGLAGMTPDQAERFAQTVAVWKGAYPELIIADTDISRLLTSTQRRRRVGADEAADCLRSILPPALSSVKRTYAVLENAERLREELRLALRKGFSNFEPPESYDPVKANVDPIVKEHGIAVLRQYLERVEDTPIVPYAERLNLGLTAYEKENYALAVFVFISIQDGLMGELCKWEGVNCDGDYYPIGTKKEALARLLRQSSYIGLETGEVIGQIGAFYDHRNAIMHGDPIYAHVEDENIATIALLFLIVTIYIALENTE